MKDYGLTVKGNIRVFRKDKEIQGNNKKKFTIVDVWYNTSEKEENGNYFNLSTNLIFKKDLEKPTNNTIINIIDSFPIVTGNDKWRKIALYVKEWAYVDNKDKTPDKAPSDDFTEIKENDDDLSF